MSSERYWWIIAILLFAAIIMVYICTTSVAQVDEATMKLYFPDEAHSLQTGLLIFILFSQDRCKCS